MARNTDPSVLPPARPKPDHDQPGSTPATSGQSRPDHVGPAPHERPRLDLSLAQVAGSVLAAVSATVITSRFGVAGTVVGAAVASTVATVGTALYAHFFRAGSTVLATSGARLLAGEHPRVPAVRQAHRRALALAVAPLVVCAVVLGGVTTLEALTGRTLSGLVGWQHGDAGGTSIGRVARSVQGRGVTPVNRSRSIHPTAGTTAPTPSAPTSPDRGPASPSLTTSGPTSAPASPQAPSPAGTTAAATPSAR